MMKDRKMAVSEESLELIIENSPDALLTVSPSGHLLYANPATEKLFERPIAEMLGTEIGLPVGGRKSTEIKVLTPNGLLKVAAMRLVQIEWEGEKALLLSLQDITARKMMEDQQRLAHKVLNLLNRPSHAEEMMREVLGVIKKSASIDAVAVRLGDGEDYPYFASDGFSEEFLKSERYLSICNRGVDLKVKDHENPMLGCMCSNIIRGRTNPEMPYFTKQGSFWTNSTSKLLATMSEADRQERACNYCHDQGYESVTLIPLRNGKEIIGILHLCDRRPDRFTLEMIGFLEGLGNSIGIALSREWLQKKLNEEKIYTEKALNSLDDIFFVVDLKGRILRWNNALNRATGYLDREIALLDLMTLVRAEDQVWVAAAIKSGLRQGNIITEAQLVAKDGRLIPYQFKARLMKDAQGLSTGFSGVARDLSEQKKLEGQLRHSQKMEAVGTLAGGVAHDFNNILTAISGFSNHALLKMTEDDPLRHNIEQIVLACTRASSLTRELMTFSRKQPSENRTINLNELIPGMESFLLHSVTAEIKLNCVCHSEPLMVRGDPQQLQQVLMNLVVNAGQAMPQGGELNVHCEKTKLGRDFIAAHGYGNPGHYAHLSVTDTGAGMSLETQQRIFEPFFTTKEVGEGTGLGLAVVYSIIKQHGGFIHVESEQGNGTTFHIHLPLTNLAEPQAKAEALVSFPTGGKETILLAEDEELLRKMLVRILEDAGYRVIAAVDGEDALEKFQENADEIRLLLFDLIMPNLNGKQASDRIRETHPDIKVIYTSGYAPDTMRRKLELDNDCILIDKPVAPQDLLVKLGKVLAQKGGERG